MLFLEQDCETKILANGIPNGAEFRGFAIDYVNNDLFIFVEHESFDEVDESSKVPTAQPIEATTSGPFIPPKE